MKWKPISELPSELVDEFLLLRIETDCKETIHAVGQVSDVSVYVLNYAGYDNYFDLRFLCNTNQLQRCGIESIYFIDPKEVEL